MDEDQDSLFGSPPPEPAARGRSPSPLLALPSSSTVAPSIISQPGPTQNSCHVHPTPTPNFSSSTSRSPSAVPPNRKNRHTSASTASKSKKSRKIPQPSLPASALDSISLPISDSASPPPNFLRNHSALLGTAGIVGGVKLGHAKPRGSTPSNPIVVDDVDDQPRIGMSSSLRSNEHQAASKLSSTSSAHMLIPTNPSLLPAPTNREIVATLMNQKDIFPVLQSILKLLTTRAGLSIDYTVPGPASTSKSGSTPPPTSHLSPSPQEGDPSPSSRASSVSSVTTPAPPLFVAPSPPASHHTKKRKLSHVPAGAADWDIPYPFATGEGPQNYNQGWEQVRAKELVGQLVGLVKGATRKAAVKKYVQEQSKGREQTVGKYYRSTTAHYGIDAMRKGNEGVNRQTGFGVVSTHQEKSPSIVDDSLSMADVQSQSASPQLPASGFSTASAPDPFFEQLLSSLLTANTQSSDHQNKAVTNGFHITEDTTSHNPFPSTEKTTHPSMNQDDISFTQSPTPITITMPSPPALAIKTSTPMDSHVHASQTQAMLDDWISILQSLPPTAPTPKCPSSSDTQSMDLDFGLSSGFDFDLSNLGELQVDIPTRSEGDVTPPNAPESLVSSPSFDANLNAAPHIGSNHSHSAAGDAVNIGAPPNSTTVVQSPSSITLLSTETVSSLAPTSQSPLPECHRTNDPSFAIDPELLALSVPNDLNFQISTGGLDTPTVQEICVPSSIPSVGDNIIARRLDTPTLVSPILSASSLADTHEAVTPTIPWETNVPDIWNNACSTEHSDVLRGELGRVVDAESHTKRRDKGKQAVQPLPLQIRETGQGRGIDKAASAKDKDAHVSDKRSSFPDLDTSNSPSLSFPMCTSPSLQSPSPYNRMGPTMATSSRATPVRSRSVSNKAEIIQRAKERRMQLVAEIERAKVELWESAIEQGVLAQLLKDTRT